MKKCEKCEGWFETLNYKNKYCPKCYDIIYKEAVEIITIKPPEIKCPRCDTVMKEGNSFWCLFFSCTWYDCPKCKKRVEVR